MAINLTPLQLDALREIGNISAGNAASAFSQIVSRKIGMNVTKAGLLSIAELQKNLNNKEVNIGISQRILGEIVGHILIVISRKNGFALIDLVSSHRRHKSDELTPYDEDILKELANILAGSYLTTLSKMTGILFIPSVPRLTVDLSETMLKNILELSRDVTHAFVVSNDLVVDQSTVSVQALLLPTPDALPVILKAIGAT